MKLSLIKPKKGHLKKCLSKTGNETNKEIIQKVEQQEEVNLFFTEQLSQTKCITACKPKVYLAFPPFFLMFLVQISTTSTQENDDANNIENANAETLGKLYFSAQYSYAQSALIVTINKCTNLHPKDSDNSRLRKMSQKLVDSPTFQ